MSALKDFSKLDQLTRRHLKNVYIFLSASLLTAALGSGVHLFFTDMFKAGFLSLIALIGLLVIALTSTSHNGKNQAKRIASCMGYAFCEGLCLGPSVDSVIQIDPSIIPTTFFAATLFFICFTLSALWAEERTYLNWAGTLLLGLLVLCLFLPLVNLFIGAQFIFQVQLYGGLLLFCGVVLFNTQLIVYEHKQGDKDFLWHSDDLFLSFLQIFYRIMIILAHTTDPKKKKN